MADRIDTVITDGALRQLAHERSAASVPVLIEVTGPTEAVEVPIGRGGGVEGRAATVVAAASTPGTAAPASATSAVSGILGRTPHYLRAARAFAADATGAQLAALAASPVVAAIRPDRAQRMVAR